jgi:hypothetical protein
MFTRLLTTIGRDHDAAADALKPLKLGPAQRISATFL